MKLTDIAEVDGNKINLSADNGAIAVFKKPIPLKYVVMNSDATIKTKEGDVEGKAGDILMTGTEGEQWPIPKKRFDETYEMVEPGWAAKRKIVVLAKQMILPFKVKVSWSDNLLHGKVNDWLVMYEPGDYGVVDSKIFNDTYERL